MARDERDFRAEEKTEGGAGMHQPAERDRERIARRAYERFEARGREHGHDQEDWFEAEREARERPGD